jgi:hypothetical protein
VARTGVVADGFARAGEPGLCQYEHVGGVVLVVDGVLRDE